MDIGVIARRYARALLAYAIEQKAEDTVCDEMQQFAREWRDVPQLAAVLHDPLRAPAEKADVICRAAGLRASDVFRRFAGIVAAHRREAYMLFIAHSYIDLWREHRHIRMARLSTATPIGDKARQRLEQWVEGTTDAGYDIRIETTVDPDLLGGFVFQVDDRRLDASVATQFAKIKKQFIEKNKRIV